MKHIKGIYLIILLCCFFIWQACQKDAVDPILSVKEYPNVDESLWKYFERFEAEAARRDIDVDLTARGISAVIEPIEAENVGGLCNYFSNNANELIIDDYIWENTSEFQKELILFHELGHCYLFRDHRDDACDDGFCKSLMRSGLSDCIDHYNGNTRNTYLDELFDPDSF